MPGTTPHDATAGEIMAAVLHTQDMVAGVHGEALTPAAVREAVRQGVTAAVSDPAMWTAAIEAIQSHAQQQAGGWLLGGIKAAASKLAWGFMIGLSIYLLGGWTAVVSFFKTASTP